MLKYIIIFFAILMTACDGHRSDVNENAAIARLKSISAAQAVFNDMVAVDQNHNGMGEYGTFGEMLGTSKLRGSDSAIGSPSLTGEFSFNKSGTFILKSGYCFQVFIPGVGGIPVTDNGSNDNKALSEEQKDVIMKQESRFIVYAWPQKAGVTGNRVFMISETGEIMYADNKNGQDYIYSGEKSPFYQAAMLIEEGETWGRAAINTYMETGQDKQVWTPLYR